MGRLCEVMSAPRTTDAASGRWGCAKFSARACSTNHTTFLTASFLSLRPGSWLKAANSPTDGLGGRLKDGFQERPGAIWGGSVLSHSCALVMSVVYLVRSKSTWCFSGWVKTCAPRSYHWTVPAEGLDSSARRQGRT